MARDPYHYFRIEAHELLEGLASGVLELERKPGAGSAPGLLRLAHTLKGAARVVKQARIGDLAHALEEILAPHREGKGAVPQAAIEQARAHIEEARALLASLGAPPGRQAPAPRAAPEEAFSSVRVDIEELDALISGISETAAATTALQLELPAGARTAQAHAEAATRELAELRTMAVDMRLVPVEVLLSELERAARDAAQSLNRSIQFGAAGAETRIDAAVLSALRGALRHIVRNAVAHGIEDSAGRAAAGKPPAGDIRLVVRRVGQRVSFLCRDDGRGIDLEATRRAAVQRGLANADAAPALGRERLLELLLRGGFSTSRTVNDVSGRGIGLDVVRETCERLKGEVQLRTRAGQGTEVEVIVPVSLSSMPALGLEAGGAAVYAPLESVKKCLRPAPAEILRSGGSEQLDTGNGWLPWADLARVLKRPAARRAPRLAVVLESGGQAAAIGVDALHGVQDIVLRQVPAHVRAEPPVAGVALDELGRPRLVLAPAAVIEWVRTAEGAPPAPAAPPRLPLLVIDDSLTTRMLEQSILESAGYEVDLAVSAEDALEMAARRRYAMFIVDVEMPGMNGFEFIARTRQMSELRDIPAVLVTSRSDPEDKRRGRDVGARAYIVKSEFNQQEILALIRGLIG